MKLGVLLTLVTSGPDGELLPIAVGHAEGETTESWTWFLTACKETFGESILDSTSLVISTDGDKGGANAVSACLPQASHIYCAKHRQVRGGCTCTLCS